MAGVITINKSHCFFLATQGLRKLIERKINDHTEESAEGGVQDTLHRGGEV